MNIVIIIPLSFLYIVLSNGGNNDLIIGNETVLNATTTLFAAIENSINTETKREAGDSCGANFCPSDSTQVANPNLVPPSTSKINLIAGIYLACMIAACLIVAFGVDSMTR